MSGESVSGRADQLRSAASAVPSGAVNQLHTALEQLRDQLAFIIGDDSAEVIGRAQQQADAAAELFRNLMALRRKLITVADHHSGTAPPAGVSGQGGPVGESGKPNPPPVVNSHGDAYPPEAAGLVELLPKRVTTGAGERTVGVIKINGRVLPQMSSGRDGMWSDQVKTHLAGSGIDASQVDAHVEMKLAAMMRETRQSSAEIAINYTPCGYEVRRRDSDTCHRVLEDYLPEGATLTVYGTDKRNQPYRHTYRGRGQL